MIIDIADELGAERIEKLRYNVSYDDVELKEILLTKINKHLEKKYKAKLPNKDIDKLRKIFEYTDEKLSLTDMIDIVNSCYAYIKNGVGSEIDYRAAREVIDKNVDSKAYEKWLNDMFDGIIAKEGIRNNKDIYTPAGNIRKFDALHYEHTLENVVKAMKEQPKQASGGFGHKNIFGGATRRLNSISDIKQNSRRINDLSQTEYDNIRSGFSERFYDISKKLAIHGEAVWSAGDLLVEAIEKYTSRDAIANYIQREGKGWTKYSSDIVDDFIQLVSEIREMPTRYFEAKPRRAVGFNEVLAAVVPDDTKQSVLDGLRNAGISDILTYKADDKADRVAVINQVANAKFSIIERGTNNEQSRSDLLLGNSRRADDESAREQTRQLQPFERENQGKTEAERKRTAKELFAEQKIGQEVISTQKGKIRINTIKADSYDADMLSIVDAYKEDGIETVLFVGKGERAFDGSKKFNINGFAIGNKIYIRYDGKIAPQNLKKHEIVHIKWDTADMQAVRENILGKMSKAEQSAILKEQRYLDYAEIYGNDVDAILEEFVADTLAGMNTHTKQYIDVVSEYWNGGDIDSYKVSEYTESIDTGDKYDYTKPFAEQVDDWKQGKIPKNDSLLVGATPDVFKKIGLNALPVTINQTHIDYALNGTKNADHNLGEVLLKQLPEAINEPIAIISSKTKNSTSLIAMLELKHGGEQIIVPVVIDGFGHQNGIRIDSNALTSAYGRNNSLKMLAKAISDEADGKLFSVYYLNKNKATALLQGARVTMPKMPATRNDGFTHSIAETDSPVKTKYKSVTETQQFKRWFGDWKNSPETASKVVNEDGTPKVVYHGTGGTFWEFDRTLIGENHIQSEGGFFFTDDKAQAELFGRLANKGQQGNVMTVYLNIKNPYMVNAPSALESIDYFDMHRGEILTEADILENDGIIIRNGIGEDLYIVFNSNQIKSATDNIGTFNGENPDIRYSLDEDGEPDLFDVWKSKVDEFGAIPKGENPTRDIDVPKKNQQR